MNGKNSNSRNLNVRYKRNAYTRKRIKVIVTISVCSVAVLAVLLILLGNFLKNRSDANIILNGGDVPSNTPVSDTHVNIQSVNGYAVRLEGLSAASLSLELGRIRDAGGNAVCFNVRSELGEELYSSSVAKDLGKQAQGDGYLSPQTLASQGSADRLYTSACIDVYAFSEQDAAKRSVKLAYDAAIGAELAMGGFDDVIFRVSELSEENIDELVRLAEAVKSIHSSAVIGIALPCESYEAEDSAELVSRLWEQFDFLACDMTGYNDSENDAAQYVSDNASAMHYYLLRYNVRVLLPEVGGETLTQMIAALADKGVSNWQTVN